MIYFDAAFFRFREQTQYEASSETRALTRITKLLSDGRQPSNFVAADWMPDS
jgi:hypothetical protein